MKKLISFSVLLSAVVLIFASTRSYSGELQFLWSKNLDSGGVLDMEFMPDNNQFIMGTTYDVQIRNTATGELLQIYPFYARNIEFTPDSAKLLTSGGWKIQLRNLNDMILLKEYNLPDGTDTTDLNYEVSVISWHKLLVDPIRPLCYALRVRSGKISNNQNVHIEKIIIYNYETMEEVGKLTIPAEETSYYKDIAISKDGKYLAAITENTSFIKVWDLNTRQKIRDFLVGYDNSIHESTPSQLTFSQINADNIYFSGTFPSKISGYNGILIYNINQNKLIDSTFAVGPLRVFGSLFALFDNEERATVNYLNKIVVLNYKTKIWEQQIDRDTISNGFMFGAYRKFSALNSYALGFSQSIFSCIKNNLGTSVPIPQSKSILYPNPSTGEVTIDISNHIINGVVNDIYIFDLNGVKITTPSLRDTPPWQGGETININVSTLPNGEYLIVLEGKEKLTYKLIINK